MAGRTVHLLSAHWRNLLDTPAVRALALPELPTTHLLTL